MWAIKCDVIFSLQVACMLLKSDIKVQNIFDLMSVNFFFVFVSWKKLSHSELWSCVAWPIFWMSIVIDLSQLKCIMKMNFGNYFAINNCWTHSFCKPFLYPNVKFTTEIEDNRIVRLIFNLFFALILWSYRTVMMR